MSENIHLITTVELNSFNIKIYSQNANLIIIPDYVSLNLAESPRQISDTLLSTDGVNLIEIFDKDNNLLLVSSNILPENINNYE